jgi:hypothetical protein
MTNSNLLNYSIIHSKTLFLLICFLGFQSFITISYAQTQLRFNGAFIILDGGSYTSPIYLVMDVADSNAILRDSGHIVSEGQYNFVSWNIGSDTGTMLFPFGYSTSDYIPVQCRKISTNNSSLLISTWATDQNNNPHPGQSAVGAVNKMLGIGDSITSAIDRFWDIRASSTMTSNLNLSYRGNENTTVNPTVGNYGAQFWTGSNWNPVSGMGAGVISGVGNVQVNEVSSYTPIVLVKSSAPVPVTLISFNANWMTESKQFASINWETASEINNAYFDLQRSYDGSEESFATVSIITGAGTSIVPNSYQFVDNLTSTSANKWYYRLRQVDFDGSETYSRIETLRRNELDSVCFKVYPNPARERVLVHVRSAERRNAELTIRNGLSQPVYQAQLKITSADFKHEINSTYLASGVYTLQLRIRNRLYTEKLIIGYQ